MAATRRAMKSSGSNTTAVVPSRHAFFDGEPGAAGHNFHGERELPGRAMFRVEPGERFGVETPGGGGWGTRPLA